MRLELVDFPVTNVKFEGKTSYSNGVLTINKEELTTLILRDTRISEADVDIAFPNDQTRIVNIRDMVEPRMKVSGPGCVFPGIMGPPEIVGKGRTHRLSGLTAMTSARYRPTIMGGTTASTAAILDMWGPASQITPFASTINIVLILKLIDTVTEWEAHTIIQMAEFRVAHHLAATTRDNKPENTEVFELFKVDPSLPKVIYMATCLTMLNEPHSLVAYYGLPIQESLPIFMHPNEFLDGAITTDARRGNGGFSCTWAWMNNPVILGLFREHGKRVNFLGVILQRTRFVTEFGKKVSAACASHMAKLLGAEGVILTRTSPSGNNFMDVMITLQACERSGIKTVMLGPEWGGLDGTDLPLVFYVPEATAMVSSGSHERSIKLPVPNKVIGIKRGEMAQQYLGDPPFDPWGELARDGWRDMIGGIDYFGGMRITCKEY